MAIKDTDRKARENYKKKVKTVRVELYGTDEDIKELLEQVGEAGKSIQGYIKDLIRAEMTRGADTAPMAQRLLAEVERGFFTDVICSENGKSTIERAEREAALIQMKEKMESHERWKQNHPRPKHSRETMAEIEKEKIEYYRKGQMQAIKELTERLAAKGVKTHCPNCGQLIVQMRDNENGK